MATESPALPTNRTFITQLFDSLSRLPGDQAAANDNANTNTNPLNNLSDATRKQLLTLQVLFPSEFVPALDLLDRRIVTRFYIRDDERRAGLTTVGAAEQEQDVRMQSVAETDTAAPQQQQEDAHIEDGSTANTDTRINPAVTTTTALESQDNPTDSNNNNNNNNTIYYVRSAQPHRPSRFTTSLESTTYYQVRLRVWNCTCPAFTFSAFPASTPDHTTQEEAVEGHVYSDADKKWVFGGMTLGTGIPPVCKHILACVFVERCKGLFGGFVEGREVSGEEAAGWGAGWGD